MNICHICGANKVREVEEFKKFFRISSDNKLCSNNGDMGVCLDCGAVQKTLSEKWYAEIDNIYLTYNIYSPLNRTKRILEQIRESINLVSKGSILEVGCGNGQFLRLFGESYRDWLLFGLELNDTYLNELETIEGFQQLFVGNPADITQKFDLIVMIHSLEHIPFPKQYLSSLKDLLNEDGYLVIEVPDYTINPFDLLIADHCSHFNKITLCNLLQDSGFDVILNTNDWVSNDLSIIVRKSKTYRPNRVGSKFFFDDVMQKMIWFENVRTQVFILVEKHSVGIFGTSSAAAWLFNELDSKLNFFVDEDHNRVGSKYLGLPVYHPQEVPFNSNVYIAVYPMLARLIKKRMDAEYKNFKSYYCEMKEDGIYEFN